ncbi:MAG: hypothetical protein ABFS46_11505 [Myxococcota bacterium]
MEAEAPTRRSLRGSLLHALPWAIAAACFAYLYWRLSGAAAREGTTLVPYMGAVFRSVAWDRWLLLMIPYSIFFFLVDSLVVWRVVGWFNARVPYLDILPVRASTYILSILNEQVGKGAIALYLNRRDGVPGWQIGSSMLFIMVCEFYYLLAWATLGVALRWEQLPAVFHAVPWLAALAFSLLGVLILYFRGAILPESKLRDRQLLHSFRRARLGHYLGVILLRSPALLAAVLVYTQALALFGVTVSAAEMLGVLPVIFFGAAVPGPFRTVAIAMWVTLFPEKAGSMATFGLVQHNFFIFFNAAIGLVFLRRANREIFGTPRPQPSA